MSVSWPDLRASCSPLRRLFAFRSTPPVPLGAGRSRAVQSVDETIFRSGKDWLRRFSLAAAAAITPLCAVHEALSADTPPAIANDSAPPADAAPAPSLAARLYATEMALGWQYWKQGMIQPLRELLARQVPEPGGKDRPDLRGFEWHYLNRLAHSELKVLPGSFPITRGLAFLGKTGRLASAHRVATNTEPGELRLWSLEGEPAATLLLREAPEGKQPPISIGKIAASSDGLTLAVDQGKELRLLNALTGEIVAIPTGHDDYIGALAFSRDGQQLASGSLDGSVRLWDRQTGTIAGELTGHRLGVLAIAWSPAGDQLVTGSGDDRAPLHFQAKNGELKLWDLTSRECICTFPNVPSQVNCVAFAGTRWVVSGGNAGEILVWDTATGLQVRRLGNQAGPIRDLAIAEEPLRVVAACQDGTARVWNLETGEELAALRGHTGAVSALALDPATGHLATGGQDGTIRLWDLAEPIERSNLGGHYWTILQTHHRANDPSIVTVDYQTARVFDPHTRQNLRQIRPGHWIVSSALTPDGQQLLLGGMANPDGGGAGHVSLWNLATGDRLAGFDPGAGNGIRVFLSPHGDWLAATGYGPQREKRFLSLWEWTPKGPGKRQGRWTIMADPVFTPDGRSLVVAQSDGLRLFDFASRTLGDALPEGTGRFAQLAVAPDGKRLAAVDETGMLTLWDLENIRVERRVSVNDGPLGRLMFSPGGETLVTADRDETILWTLPGMVRRARIAAPTGQMLITPDNRTLVTAWQTLDFWHLETGLPMLQLDDYQMQVPGCLSISPDGNWISEGGGWRDENEGVYLWHARPFPASR